MKITQVFEDKTKEGLNEKLNNWKEKSVKQMVSNVKETFETKIQNKKTFYKAKVSYDLVIK